MNPYEERYGPNWKDLVPYWTRVSLMSDSTPYEESLTETLVPIIIHNGCHEACCRKHHGYSVFEKP